MAGVSQALATCWPRNLTPLHACDTSTPYNGEPRFPQLGEAESGASIHARNVTPLPKSSPGWSWPSWAVLRSMYRAARSHVAGGRVVLPVLLTTRWTLSSTPRLP